jgi:phosphatidylinositol glycan class M
VFIDESYLYHIRRQDVRHNFSMYFYPLYLLQDSTALSKLLSIGAFVPQAIAVFGIAFKFYDDLPFCMFLQVRLD